MPRQDPIPVIQDDFVEDDFQPDERGMAGVVAGHSSTTTDPTFLQRVKAAIMSEAQDPIDLAVGAGKEILRGQRMESQFYNPPKPGSGDPATNPEYKAQLERAKSVRPSVPMGRDPLEPTNDVQRAGGFGANIGMGIAAGAATGGASLPTQTAVGGITGAALTPENPTLGWYTGSIAPPLGKYVGEPVGRMLGKKAQELVASVFNPRNARDKQALANVLPELTAEHPFAWSSEGLYDRFFKKADEAGALFDDMVKTAEAGGTVVNVSKVAQSIDPMIDALKNSKGAFATPEAASMAKELRRVRAQILRSGSRQGADRLGLLSDVRQLKQQFGKIVEGAKGFDEALPFGSRAAGAKEGYYATQRGMAEQVPGLTEQGSKYHKYALGRDLLRKNEWQNIGGNPSQVGNAAEAAMAIFGHPAEALAVRGALKAGRGTPFRLGSAALLDQAKNLLAAGDHTGAAKVMSQFLRESAAGMQSH